MWCRRLPTRNGSSESWETACIIFWHPPPAWSYPEGRILFTGNQVTNLVIFTRLDQPAVHEIWVLGDPKEPRTTHNRATPTAHQPLLPPCAFPENLLIFTNTHNVFCNTQVPHFSFSCFLCNQLCHPVQLKEQSGPFVIKMPPTTAELWKPLAWAASTLNDATCFRIPVEKTALSQPFQHS